MIVGRKTEQEKLLEAKHSEYSQFIAVYGRRRVGKTFLIRETFDYTFTFQHTGLAKGKTSVQLENFRQSLIEAGYDNCPHPKTWRVSSYLLPDWKNTDINFVCLVNVLNNQLQSCQSP